jgi:signal transduction histidine kinase
MLFGLALMFALMPLMQLAGFAREMRMIVNVCIPLLFVLLLLTLTSVARKKSDQPVPVFLLFAYLGIYSLLISIPAMINLGGLEALAKPASPRQIDAGEPVSTVISVWQIIAVYASLASLMLDGLLMRVLLIHRARALHRAQHKTEFELLRSKEESLARARLSEEQSKLFSMLAHEMKTPLATLRMWIDAGPAARAAMERAISDMNQVIERCVHTGQLAEQGLQPMPQADDAAGLTTAGIQACRAPERVRLSGPEGPAPILADTQMLSIALNNLLDNALKYSPAHTRIEVTLREEARDAQAGWTWQVRNHPGQAGMPDAGRVFDKYYRSLGARHQSGSGLGLFLVQGLLELMGGTVRFEARDGQAVFTMWVPAAPPPR